MPHRPPVSTHLGGIRVAGGEALAARRTREWGGFAGHPDPSPKNLLDSRCNAMFRPAWAALQEGSSTADLNLRFTNAT